MPPVPTAEEKEKEAGARLNSMTIGIGVSNFDSKGFSGTDHRVSPSYTWKLGGGSMPNELTLTVPVEEISVEGMESYRAGMILQFVHPFAMPGGVVLKAGPSVSYSYLVSPGLGATTGTIGGGLTAVLRKEWDPYFGDFGLFYGRFQDLGGFKTDLTVNSYSYGLQFGRRVVQRWVVSVYGIGVNDDVSGQPGKNYGLVGAAVAYRIYKSFNLQLSANRTIGLSDFRDTAVDLGSAWNF
jgi:hypothetical protein